MHLVGYLYEAYHDARSLEHKVLYICLMCKNVFEAMGKAGPLASG